MNLLRGLLPPGAPRFYTPFRPWLPANFIAKSPGKSIAVLLLASALASTPCARALENPPSNQAAEADVLPGRNAPPAGDLQLHGDYASKAGALAAFSQAIMAEDAADSDTALEDYKKALALDPGYTELAVKVAFEMARRGDPSDGVEVLKDSIKAAPKAPLAYLYLSQLYSKFLNKPELGLKFAQQALALDPVSFASYIAEYEILGTLNQPEKAAALLDEAAKQKSTDPQYWLQLGDFYLKSLGDNPSKEAIKKADVIFGHALENAGTDSETLAHVADFYARTEQEARAIPLYLDAIKYSPANTADGDETIPDARENLARCFDAVGKTSQAIATVKQLVKEEPLRYDSYDLLCRLYDKANQNDAAIAICQQMMLLKPADFGNYIREAALMMKEKRTDDAITLLSDAREKFPTEAQVTYSLGLALSEAKRYKEAVDIFDQAVDEAQQGQTEMLDAEFYFAYGAAAEQAGQLDKAVEMLKKSIQLDPQAAAEAYNYIGFMWVDRGMNLDEGADYIKKALRMDPDNPAYLDSLGWYYFKKKDIKNAVELLKKAAKLIQPEDATVDEHLGDAYAASNETAKALEYWQRSSNIDKDNKEIAVKIAGAKEKLAKQDHPAQ
ncbi:MAG TPA: tetratricopeptide repeat protein [Chthoniobacteraceae bacterium]|jgi:tetratricopeptide (TPR) repeat protein|nr:tetratricopeptide repeat protein [Chthoniobacteraceae bacterium]